MSIGRLIYRNLARNGFRSGVIFACALLLAALPFAVAFMAEGGRAGLRVMLGRLGADLLVVPQGAAIKVETALLMGKPASAWMPAGNLDKIARLPGVARVSPQIHLATLAGASCCSAPDMFLVAFDPATDFTLRPWLDQSWGGLLETGEVLGGSQISVPTASQAILIYGTPVRLKGNLAPSGTGLDQTMFMTIETARELARMSATRAERELVIPTNQISAILVKLRPGAAPADVIARIAREVPGVATLQSPELFRGARQELSGLSRLGFAALVLVWAISVAAAGLVFSLAAHERRRELGVLRVLGASRGLVLRLLLAEAAVLGMAGAACGLALCLAIAFWFREAIVFLLQFPFLFPAPGLLACLVAGGLLAASLSVVLAALGPAWRISRLEPALAARE